MGLLKGLSEALHAELSPLGIHVTVVEPGSSGATFSTKRNVDRSCDRLADYDATAGAVRAIVPELSHKQPGDP